MIPRSTLFVVIISSAFACATKDPESSSYTTDDRDDLLSLDPDTAMASGGGELEECEEVTTKITTTYGDGRPDTTTYAEEAADPTVGDEWFVRMYCNGIVTTGITRLFFQPANVAQVQDNNTIADFIAPGDALMTMQSGNLVYTKNITVAAAP